MNQSTLPECSILVIVFSDVEGTKWFSKFLDIIRPIHIRLKWHHASSSQSLELLPKRPLEVDVAVVEEKHRVVGRCCHVVHVTAYALMNTAVRNADGMVKTVIVCFQKCIP